MMHRVFALLACSACAALAQSPVVTEILNNYSLANPGTVAQGAIFIVKGSNLSDTTTGLQEVPLLTQLQGVQIVITVNGVTRFAPLYYVLPQQLAGILPSSIPVGTGTLTIRNNLKNSLAVPINVVRSAFGMLTASGTGTGAARVQDASQGYQELISSRSTNPGNVLVFYGSGVGAVAGDETIGQVQTDLTTIPISVTIGGKLAQVYYRGRTTYPGLDQINVQVPLLDAGSYGCAVPVVILTNNFPANATTIPVAERGSNCAQGGGGGPVSGATGQEVDRWIAGGSLTMGQIQLTRLTTHSVVDDLPGLTAGTTVTKTDSFGAVFERVSGSGLTSYLRGERVPAIGQCVVSREQLALTRVALDAGPSVTASGPGGTHEALRTGLTYTARVFGPFLGAGRWTVSGSGGPAVGAFSGNVDAPGELTLVNPDDFKTIVRGDGVTVRWTGGDASQPVHISGSSRDLNVDGTVGGSVSFDCLANGADGRFTVPAGILTQLPPSGVFGGPVFAVPLRGSFTVSAGGRPVRITASGMDYLAANASWSWLVTALYK